MPDKLLAGALKWWVGRVQQAPLPALVAGLLIAAGLTGYAALNLGVDTSTEDMLSEDLDWRRDFIDFKDAFPRFNRAILVVIDAPVPEQAEEAAERLVEKLRGKPDLFHGIEWLAGSEFFRRHGLLYLEPDELDQRTERLVQAQPLLGRLARQPDLHGLAGLMEDIYGRDSAVTEDTDDQALDDFVRSLVPAVEAAGQGRLRPVSWRMEPAEPPSGGALQVITVEPHIEFSRLLPGQRPIQTLRELAEPIISETGAGVTVRLTGPTVLQHEELLSVSRGALWGALAALTLVVLVLYWALRSWRMIVAAVVTLVAGLGATAGFAALAVGHLNLISIAFAVLYIGLGIDFIIHYCLRYRELLGQGLAAPAAINTTAGDVGVSLLLCALTTSVGFFAFIPTDFLGVAELGLIAGVGMYISLAASLTVLPALLSLMPGAAPRREPSDRAARMLAMPQRRAGPVIVTFAVLAGVATWLVTGLEFDSDPMNLRDADTESVRTYFDLVERSDDPPLSISMLAGDLEQATRLQDRFEALDTVSHTRSLADFVPAGQDAKLERIDELRWLLGPDLRPGSPENGDRGAAVERLSEAMGQADSEAGRELASVLADFRAGLAGVGAAEAEQRLERLQTNLFKYFPVSLERLEQALTAGQVTLADVPAAVRQNWISPDGRYRIEVYPVADLSLPGARAQFVDSVRELAPQATGRAVVQHQAGFAVQRAFRDAFVMAGLIIAVLLAVLMRSIAFAVVVMVPLGLAALLTAGTAAGLGMSLSFANVIALPLLLGVGVDSGIHMVHRMRSAPPPEAPGAVRGGLLRTSTAAAVLFSALTTTASFGNLALSAHPGTASMGQLLVIGMLCVALTTLILLPALLACVAGRRARVRP